MEAFERKCLLSYSTNRSGEVIKKYNFPTLPPYNESQKEDRMIHQMNQAIGHAFVNHAPIMATYVHNAVLKTLQDRGTPGFVGPAYQQASQMAFSPTGSAIGTSQIHPQAQTDEGVLDVQPIKIRLLWSLNRVGENRRSGLTEIWTVGFVVSGFTAVETGLHIGYLTSARLLGAEGTLGLHNRS